MEGLGFRVWGSRVRVGLGFRVDSPRSRRPL